MLNIGDKAPAFRLDNQDGKSVSLSDFSGKKVVIYFYPKDDTPGCTIEAKEFTDRKAEFDAKNTVILGVSKDSVKSHEKFCNKHSLGITLLSDESGEMVESYGAWQEKKNYGKTYMGIVRSTFLIDEEGSIMNIWPNVRVKGHVDAVLESI